MILIDSLLWWTGLLTWILSIPLLWLGPWRWVGYILGYWRMRRRGLTPTHNISRQPIGAIPWANQNWRLGIMGKDSWYEEVHGQKIYYYGWKRIKTREIT